MCRKKPGTGVLGAWAVLTNGRGEERRTLYNSEAARPVVKKGAGGVRCARLAMY